ncbi:hypothetical protein LJC07_06220 [Christensenellaceae bacterium OttesenSCG-928-L17]|nr:hypothetical protein [Christensenellaceae bacterium OttesenSCG-928-L17]
MEGVIVEKKINWYSIKAKVLFMVLLDIVLSLPVYLSWPPSYVWIILYRIGMLFIAILWRPMRCYKPALLSIGAFAASQAIYWAMTKTIIIPFEKYHLYLILIDASICLVDLLLQYGVLRSLYGWKRIVLKRNNAILLGVFLLFFFSLLICDYLYGYWQATRTEYQIIQFLHTVSYDPYTRSLTQFSQLVYVLQILFFSIIMRNSNVLLEENAAK